MAGVLRMRVRRHAVKLMLLATMTSLLVCVVLLSDATVRSGNFIRDSSNVQLTQLVVGDAFLNTRPNHEVANSSAQNNILNTSSQCQVIHIAFTCVGAKEIRDAVDMVRTLVTHIHDQVTLYIFTSPTGNYTLSTLLKTWQLPGLTYNITVIPSLSINTPDVNKTSYMWSQITDAVPSHVQKMIYVTPYMRFLADIRELWDLSDSWRPDIAVGIVQSQKLGVSVYLTDIAVINLAALRNTSLFASLIHVQSFDAFDKYLKASSHIIQLIPCAWNVRIEESTQFLLCQEQTKALWWGSSSETVMLNNFFDEKRDMLEMILNSNGDSLRQQSSPCFRAHPPSQSGIISKATMCSRFAHLSNLPKRTHYFFAGSVGIEPHPDVEVTLMVQLTYDRFHMLVLMLTNWLGPASVALYLNDWEARQLHVAIGSTKVLSKRTNVAYHVVYRRGEFLPINFLRNVAIIPVRTSHGLYVDADLIINPDAYGHIKTHIMSQQGREATKVAMVIPAYKTTLKLDTYPANKTALLPYIRNGTVMGYQTHDGWQGGHKPTNFKLWESTDTPYTVKYTNVFEPYVVVKLSEAPLFNASLYERMADKSSFIKHLFYIGFEFKVFPYNFLIHFPHELSPGVRHWCSSIHYHSCTVLFLKDFAHQLKNTYGDKEATTTKKKKKKKRKKKHH